MTQSCFSWKNNTVRAFSAYSLNTAPAKVLLAPQTSLIYRNLLTFHLNLVVPVTGFFKGCSKNYLMHWQIYIFVKTFSHCLNLTVQQQREFFRLDVAMNIPASPADISISCLWELLARRASTSLPYGHKGHNDFEPSASISSYMGF